MRYLIDGHNLINALPDVSMDDPHDEAKLVEKLRSEMARRGKRCVVVFDHGLPGGPSRDLSSGQVEVIFASAFRSNADRVIMERIARASDANVYHVVSSDQQVREAAVARRMRVISSEAFAAQMGRASPAIRARHAREKRLSQAEIEEWLRLFGADEDGEE